VSDASNSRGALRFIDVYAQATAEVGMGHLSRAAAVVSQMEDLGFSCRITADVDQCGRRFARRHRIALVDELRGDADVVVIDAVDVSPEAEQVISRYPIRILISPSFRRADLATHALVRDAPPELVASLDVGTRLVVDSRFAFATSHGIEVLADDFADIRVGVCLTGGSSSIAAVVVECLLAASSISRVTAIADLSMPVAGSHGSKLRHLRFTDDPWRLFRTCNVFVGGDGVMVGEAVARAFPTFSLTTQHRMAKNRGLIRAGAIEPVLVEEFDCQSLLKRLTDRGQLLQLQDAAKLYFRIGDSYALASAIAKVCHE
jgi:spore coat polysaccharide biosynthesis predicted glycosyltransferase SpsG